MTPDLLVILGTVLCAGGACLLLAVLWLQILIVRKLRPQSLHRSAVSVEVSADTARAEADLSRLKAAMLDVEQVAMRVTELRIPKVEVPPVELPAGNIAHMAEPGMERWRRLGAAGLCVSVCYGPGPWPGREMYWSVDVLGPRRQAFNRPLAAAGFCHALEIAEAEAMKRGWLPDAAQDPPETPDPSDGEPVGKDPA